MIFVAENINIMSKSIGPAMRGKEAKPVQKMAAALQEAGADYLDINLGPARKGGPEMMEWVVKTVQEVAHLPLYLDTTNVEAMEAGLKAHKESAGRPVINSISAVAERMDALLPMAKRYGAELVALLYGKEGIPRDENERGVLAADLLAKAAELGIEVSEMWFDPIVVPVSSQQNQVQSCTAFMSMLPDMAPGSKSTCGLSNVSNGSPESLRPILNQAYLCMLRKHGLYAAIMDGLDKEIMRFARDKETEIEKLVGRVMDGETIDPKHLDERQRKFYKTAKVLLGQTLYSDSWLEI